MLRFAVGLTLAGVMSSGYATIQPATCDPNAPPTDQQIARRKLAIGAARQINTAEAKASAENKRYAPLGELTGVSVPEGFEAQVSTDGTSYTFSIKDSRDACSFAVFSDQKGLIYTATPLR